MPPDDLSAAQGNFLPPAVRRQAERADELLRQVAEEQKLGCATSAFTIRWSPSFVIAYSSF